MPGNGPGRSRNAGFVLMVVLAPLFLPAPPVWAFSDNTMFLGRAVKPAPDGARFEGGVRFEIAPVYAASREIINRYREEHPEIEPVFDYVRSVDATKLASASADEIMRKFLEIPWLKERDREIIRNTFDEQRGDPAVVSRSVSAVNQLAPLLADREDAISFSLAPYAVINLEAVQFALEVPLAGFTFSGDTSFTLGNINLDARFGHVWGERFPLALSYGLALYLPTAGARANSLGLQSVFGAPRFMHEYFAMAPYLAAGVDLRFFKLQGYLEFLDLIAARGAPRHSVGVALRYGAAAIFDLFSVFALNLELHGAHPLKHAGMFKALSLFGGFRVNLFGARLGVGVEYPIIHPEPLGLADYAGIDFGSPARVNVVVNLAYGF